MFDSSNLSIPRQQASRIAAALIVCLFIVFAAGYYLGKQHAADITISGETMAEESLERGELELPDETPQTVSAQDNYTAQLVGYGTQKKALAFIERLKKSGIETILKTRVSTTAKGKKITWYQVTTQPYTDRHKLQSLIDRIVKLEHIRNYCIVKYNS
ncbi:MAG: SPOR domain-containing protein [Candidatus Babeliales bacterium]